MNRTHLCRLILLTGWLASAALAAPAQPKQNPSPSRPAATPVSPKVREAIAAAGPEGLTPAEKQKFSLPPKTTPFPNYQGTEVPVEEAGLVAIIMGKDTEYLFVGTGGTYTVKKGGRLWLAMWHLPVPVTEDGGYFDVEVQRVG